MIWFVVAANLLQAQVITPVDSLDNQSSAIVKEPLNEKKHSPRTATLLSLALPGAGQVYNKKNWWWKVPVIYGAGAGLVYGLVFYNKNYNDFRGAYKYRVENNVNFNNEPRFDKFETATLLNIRESYREARDQCMIGLILVYSLQIVDAAVEAHFFDFNVSDDLSLNVQPQFAVVPYSSAGVQLTFKFK